MPNGSELAKAIYEQALARFVDESKRKPGDEYIIMLSALYQEMAVLAERLPAPGQNDSKNIIDHAREKGPWVAGGGGFIAFITWLLDMLSKRGG